MQVLRELGEVLLKGESRVLLLREFLEVSLELLFVEDGHGAEEGPLVEKVKIHVGTLLGSNTLALLQLGESLLGRGLVGLGALGLLDRLFNFDLLLRLNLSLGFRFKFLIKFFRLRVLQRGRSHGFLRRREALFVELQICRPGLLTNRHSHSECDARLGTQPGQRVDFEFLTGHFI